MSEGSEGGSELRLACLPDQRPVALPFSGHACRHREQNGGRKKGGASEVLCHVVARCIPSSSLLPLQPYLKPNVNTGKCSTRLERVDREQPGDSLIQKLYFKSGRRAEKASLK